MMFADARVFELTRVWAALTGIALAAFAFARAFDGHGLGHVAPMLVAAIGGFEMVLFGQDVWRKRGPQRR